MTMIPIPEAEVSKTYAAVGEALSTWTIVETDITVLFYALCGNKTRAQAAAIMTAIISFDTRLDVVDALFALKEPNASDAEFWRKLMVRCQKYYKKRHPIAHFRLVGAEKKGGGVAAEIAPFFNYEKWLSEDLDTLSRQEIIERTVRFSNLHDALVWVMRRLTTRRRREGYFAPSRKEPEPAMVTTLRALVAQTPQATPPL